MNRITLPDKQCIGCGKTFTRESCKQISDYRVKRFCSRDCYSSCNIGNNHHLWKGGFKTRPDGYIRDSKTGKYIHRIIMEEYIGRELLSSEHIHHIDGNPKNNDIKNLMIMSNSEHRRLENLYAKRDNKGKYVKK